MSNTSRLNLVGASASTVQDLVDLVRTTQENARHLVLSIEANEYTKIPYPRSTTAFPATLNASPLNMLIVIPVIGPAGIVPNEGAVLSFKRDTTMDEWYTGLWYEAEWYGNSPLAFWQWDLPTIAMGGDQSMLLLPRHAPPFVDIMITSTVKIEAFDVYFF